MQSNLVVTTAADSQDLLSLYMVRQELDIQVNTFDSRLERWITEASARISDFCGRSFRKETLTETFWADSRSVEPVILTRTPVVSITSITDSGQVLTSDGYRLRGQRLWRMTGDDQIAFSRVGEVVVVYIAGYDNVTDVPGALNRACLMVVKDMWTMSTRGDSSLKRESVQVDGVETIQNEYFDRGAAIAASGSGLPPNVEQILVNFRDIMI